LHNNIYLEKTEDKGNFNYSYITGICPKGITLHFYKEGYILETRRIKNATFNDTIYLNSIAK